MKFEFDYECDKGWDEMKGGDRQRFCDSCEKHVHHISGMTEKQAREFLERHDYEVCVDFFQADDGHAVFSERERKLYRQNDGLKQLVASALAIVPLALGAAFIDFDQAETPEPVVIHTNPVPAPPINLGGPAPVVVTPTIAPHIDRPNPVIPDIAPEIIIGELDDTSVVPEVEDTPDVEPPPIVNKPQPIIEPPRPRLRGRIKRPSLWEHD